MEACGVLRQKEGDLDFRLEQYPSASGACRQSFCPASEIAVRDQGVTKQSRPTKSDTKLYMVCDKESCCWGDWGRQFRRDLEEWTKEVKVWGNSNYLGVINYLVP